jgi:aspartyl-tRNA(Asn)/glutamyl-tRNA(Gln) amidotransferase subunit B
MRSKEGSEDYRYFPEPDLVPVAPTDEMRAAARDAVGELPAARRERLIAEWGVSETDARTLLEAPGLADYAEGAVAAGATGRDVTNWVTGEVLAHLNETGLSPVVLPFPPDALAELIGLVDDGTLSRGLAKDVLAEGLRDGKRPRAVVEDRGLAQVNDAGELASVVAEILGANVDAVAEYRAGDDKARKKKRGFLMGELMKATKGSANPKVLNQLLDEALA